MSNKIHREYTVFCEDEDAVVTNRGNPQHPKCPNDPAHKVKLESVVFKEPTGITLKSSDGTEFIIGVTNAGKIEVTAV